MQTQLPVVKPVQFQAAAKPAASVGLKPSADNTLFAGKSHKFAGGDGRGNIVSRFVKWLRNTLHFGMDKLEKSNPEALLNAEHNRLVTDAKEANEALSRIIGNFNVMKTELAQQIAVEQEERAESEAAFTAYEKALAENNPNVAAYEKKALAELDEADRELAKVNEMQARVQQAELQVKQAKLQIDNINAQLQQAISKLDQAKQSHAEKAALQQLVSMQNLLNEASGKAVGLTNSVGSVIRDIEVEKEALKSQLNGGRSNEEVMADLEVDEAIREAQQKSRLDAVMAQRQKAREAAERLSAPDADAADSDSQKSDSGKSQA